MNKPEKQYVNAEGRYLCKVKQPGNGWLGESSTGKEFIRIPLIVQDAGDQHGREIVWQGWLSEAAIGRTTKALDEAFGREWDIRSLAEGRSSFVGKLCRITVAAEDYNGETRFKIKWLNPAESSAPESGLSAEKIDELARRFATIERAGESVAAPKPAAAKPVSEQDDIPF